jgi:hypothetical protein
MHSPTGEEPSWKVGKMRLKKKYQAVIVAVMIILTAVLASFIVSSVQGTRIAYVAVSADKSSYSYGENITFNLKPLSQGVQFTVSGTSPNEGVRIIRIPDWVDPDKLLSDYSMMSNLTMWGSRSTQTVVPIPQFNSTGDAMALFWNGTISTYDRDSNGLLWGQATAGYYILYPYYNWMYGHTVKFMLDRSSIFYYDSLKVDFNVTSKTNITIDVDMTLPEGSSPTEGNFSSFVTGAVVHNYTDGFYNFSVNLQPGQASRISISFLSPGYSNTGIDVLLRTHDGDFIFGFWSNGYYNSDIEGGMILVQY